MAIISYLWYSAQHHAYMRRKPQWTEGPKNPLLGKLDNGAIVEYTAMSDSETYEMYQWPDKVLLGKGRYAGS